MKKFALLTVAAIAVIFTACDNKDLLDIALNGELTKKINIDYADTSASLVQTIEFSLADNEEFAKYGDKVKSVEISKIAIQFDNVTIGEDNTTLQAAISLLTSTGQIDIEIPVTAVKQADIDNVTVVEYAFTGDEAALLGADLLTAGKSTIAFTGDVTNAPLNMDMIVTITASLKASPLN